MYLSNGVLVGAVDLHLHVGRLDGALGVHGAELGHGRSGLCLLLHGIVQTGSVRKRAAAVGERNGEVIVTWV